MPSSSAACAQAVIKCSICRILKLSKMLLQYDTIGKTYNALQRLPIQALAKQDCYSVLGDLTGLKVLDLACGTGQDSRKLVELGASHVTGIDISPAMVDVAQQDLPSDLKGRITYHVGDCARQDMFHGSSGLASQLGTFDVVFAGYLLNYAPTAAALHSMFANIVSALRPGGRFVCLTVNSPIIAQFGFGKPFEDRGMGTMWEVVATVGHGYKFRVTADVTPQVRFECFWLRPEVYAAAAESAGLRRMEWKPVLSDAEAIDEHGKGFWSDNDGRPRCALYMGVKPGADGL